jgi:hypothetical protein
LAVKASKMPYLDALDILGAIDAFAAEPNGGLIMIPTSPTAANRTLIHRLAMQYRLPTIYPYGEGVAEGGLIAFGTNNVDRFRSASSFVDRILRGSKVNELPIEFPTKFELVINLKTAKALGLVSQAALRRDYWGVTRRFKTGQPRYPDAARFQVRRANRSDQSQGIGNPFPAVLSGLKSGEFSFLFSRS